MKVEGRKGRVVSRARRFVTASSFWEDRTAEELAREQGIKPIADVNQLAGYWPEDADFEEFLKAVEGARKH